MQIIYYVLAYILWGLLVFKVPYACGRYYNDARLCDSQSQSFTTDCSNQLPKGEFPSCVVYNTLACSNASYWTFHNLQEVIIEPSHAGFAVHVEAYPWNDLHLSPLVTPAYNFTLVSLRQDITGFLLLLSQVGDLAYNSCRIFDFSKAGKQKFKMLSIYYDCFSNLNEANLYHYNLVVRSLPQNEELHYLTTVPKAKHIEPLSVALWESTVMVYVPSLDIGRVDIKFQPAPHYLEVGKYKVLLEQVNTQTPHANVDVFHNGSKKMLEVSFDLVPSGAYTVSVTAVHEQCHNSCIAAVSQVFVVRGHIKRYIWLVTLLAVLASLLITGMGIYLLYSITTKYRNVTLQWKTSPSAFIVYSYDCPCHMNLVECFSECLSQCGNIHVILDKSHLLNQNYSVWLCDTISKCDFVIVMISPGACAKARKLQHRKPCSTVEDGTSNFHLTEGLTWGDLFTPALNIILHFITSKKLSHERVFVIYFDYFKPENALSVLNVGHDFRLMSDFNLLLHCLHGIRLPWLYRKFLLQQKIIPACKGNCGGLHLKALNDSVSLMNMCNHQIQGNNDP